MPARAIIDSALVYGSLDRVQGSMGTNSVPVNYQNIEYMVDEDSLTRGM